MDFLAKKATSCDLKEEVNVTVNDVEKATAVEPVLQKSQILSKKKQSKMVFSKLSGNIRIQSSNLFLLLSQKRR